MSGYTDKLLIKLGNVGSRILGKDKISAKPVIPVLGS